MCPQPGRRPASEIFDENTRQGSVSDHGDLAVNQIFLKRVKHISAARRETCEKQDADSLLSGLPFASFNQLLHRLSDHEQ
jgi:hypothetical protein